MFIAKEKKNEINELVRDARGNALVTITDSCSGIGLKKDIMVFGDITEISAIIDDLIAIREATEKVTGIRF